MQARYYDPVIGRFYSNDPVGFTGEVDTFNRYSYVANTPYKYTDPTGMAKGENNEPKRCAMGLCDDGTQQKLPSKYKNGEYFPPLPDIDDKPLVSVCPTCYLIEEGH